jgi:hypothetical protein
MASALVRSIRRFAVCHIVQVIAGIESVRIAVRTVGPGFKLILFNAQVVKVVVVYAIAFRTVRGVVIASSRLLALAASFVPLASATSSSAASTSSTARAAAPAQLAFFRRLHFAPCLHFGSGALGSGRRSGAQFIFRR